MSAELAKKAEAAIGEFGRAIKFVPKEKRNWKPAATSRSAQEILGHTVYWTEYMTRGLRGEMWKTSEEEWLRTTQELKDAEQALQLAERYGGDFVATIEKLTPSDLAKQVEMPWGRQTLADVVGGGIWHLTYHSGQLNYIQTMLGDKEDHW